MIRSTTQGETECAIYSQQPGCQFMANTSVSKCVSSTTESSDEPKLNDADMVSPDSFHSQTSKSLLASKLQHWSVSVHRRGAEQSRQNVHVSFYYPLTSIKLKVSLFHLRARCFRARPRLHHPRASCSSWIVEITLRLQLYTMVNVQTSY